MLNENAQAWVDALRSGDYEQGRNNLHTVEADYSLFCCLGVACDLFAKAHPEAGAWKPAAYPAQSFMAAIAELPNKVCDWLGLAPVSQDAAFEGYPNTNVAFLQNTPRPQSLIVLNDGGSTFAEIADVIEGHQKELFNAE